MAKIRVAVLFGGQSSEHDVSEMSARSIIENIDTAKYEVVPIGITKDGRWLLYNGPSSGITESEWEKDKANGPACLVPGSGEKSFLTGKGQLKVNVVFPVLHGKFGEDGTVQGLLEIAGIPYVGCGVLASALCMDKVMTNRVLDAQRIIRCEWDFMCKEEMDNFNEIENRVAEKLKYPIFVKPANAGSSVGVSKAHNKPELYDAVKLALRHDSKVVFEEFINGREIEVAVIGNAHPFASDPGEILASKDFYDYEDKYLKGEAKTQVPADLMANTKDKIHRVALEAYKALGCEGLARVDFFVERKTGRVLINEVNTMPGFTKISMYPKMMTASGMKYSDVLDELIMLALKRSEGKNG